MQSTAARQNIPRSLLQGSSIATAGAFPVTTPINRQNSLCSKIPLQKESLFIKKRQIKENRAPIFFTGCHYDKICKT